MAEIEGLRPSKMLGTELELPGVPVVPPRLESEEGRDRRKVGSQTPMNLV